MKLSRVTILGAVLLIAVFLGGCASTPTAPTESAFEIGNRPQMLMPGAVRSEVKGLAMGAARSKGWTIVKSTEDRLVVQRPVDPGSAAAATLGANASVIPPVIEVTSAFIQRSDGVLVGLGAELVSQPPGEKAPKRVDYTETYRDALNRSLESLRSNWAANRQRVANSQPTHAVQLEGESEVPGSGASTNPLVRVWADTLEEEKASRQGATAGSSGTTAGRPSTTAPPRSAERPAEPWPEPKPAAPDSTAVRAAPVSAPAAPVTSSASPPAAARGGGPAPVVEGSLALRSGSAAAEPLPVAAATRPGVHAESVPPEQNMLVLNQAGGTGTWAYYAEQYARLRGCEVTEQGALLIESRTDSEILKVPCQGADSFLVKCQNGVCRGLE